MHCLNCMFLLPQRLASMPMHVFSLLQTKLGYMLCSCVEMFILVELQQTMDYHPLCLFSLVMLLCAVVVCSSSIMFVWSYFLKNSYSIKFFRS